MSEPRKLYVPSERPDWVYRGMPQAAVQLMDFIFDQAVGGVVTCDDAFYEAAANRFGISADDARAVIDPDVIMQWQR